MCVVRYWSVVLVVMLFLNAVLETSFCVAWSVYVIVLNTSTASVVQLTLLENINSIQEVDELKVNSSQAN